VGPGAMPPPRVWGVVAQGWNIDGWLLLLVVLLVRLARCVWVGLERGAGGGGGLGTLLGPEAAHGVVSGGAGLVRELLVLAVGALWCAGCPGWVCAVVWVGRPVVA
jgi:hypothetical protein